MSRIRDTVVVKTVLMHPKAREALKEFPKGVKQSFGKAIFELQQGFVLGMPISKPMPSVGAGVEELRVKDPSGIYRTFYFKKSSQGILVFHAFVKKTQKTPKREIEIGRKRLKEMLK